MTDDPRLPAIAEEVLRGTLDRDPVAATYLGDHERDGLLPDLSAHAATARARELRAQIATVDALPPSTADDDVDAAVLQTVLAAELFELDELHEAEWNPVLHNPGGGIHALLNRNFAPLAERLESVTARLAAVPDYLAAARERLTVMPAVHVRTARDQLAGTIGLLDTAVPVAVRAAGVSPSGLDVVLPHAREALAAHRDWLAVQDAEPGRGAAIGESLFRAKLALALDTAFDPQQLLAEAEAELERVSFDISGAAAEFLNVPRADANTVRDALDRLALDVVDDAAVLDACRAAFVETSEFVQRHELVTVLPDPVEIGKMAEVDRGVALAHCVPNGPLETAELSTRFEVSPAPADWTPDQVASFRREYNAHMLHDLTVHEAMPGHALQLMHATRHRGRTRVRSVWWSGSFVEGWAVYAEELMADRGYRSEISSTAAQAVRLQMLKMQLRTIINTILDIRFHCGDLDESAALDLMRRRGHQEEGEAIAKWRRVQLTSTQLCTYLVGFLEVRSVARDLRSAQPGWTDRQLHDALLAHGSPPARHLRTLLGLAPHA